MFRLPQTYRYRKRQKSWSGHDCEKIVYYINSRKVVIAAFLNEIKELISDKEYKDITKKSLTNKQLKSIRWFRGQIDQAHH